MTERSDFRNEDDAMADYKLDDTTAFALGMAYGRAKTSSDIRLAVSQCAETASNQTFEDPSDVPQVVLDASKKLAETSIRWVEQVVSKQETLLVDFNAKLLEIIDGAELERVRAILLELEEKDLFGAVRH
jgi:hypothetical protein